MKQLAKISLFTFILITYSLGLHAQKKSLKKIPSTSTIDAVLIRKVDSMYTEKQLWLEMMNQVKTKKIDSINGIFIAKKIIFTDSFNFAAITKICPNNRYLGSNILGKTGEQQFFDLIRDFSTQLEFQNNLLTSMQLSAKKGFARYTDYASLRDKVNLALGKQQEFGTILRINDSKTSYEVAGNHDLKTINLNRKAISFGAIELEIQKLNVKNSGMLLK